MNRILLILIIFNLIFNGAFCFSFNSENLYPINDKSGGGYINKDGVVKIEQKYGFTGRFEGNYAIVQAKDSKYGVIDKNGNVVVDFIYDDLKNLNENFVIYKKDAKYGFIDIVKNKKSDAVFDNIKTFKEGLAGAEVNKKWGFIDKNGKYIVEPRYYDVANFSEGLAAVSESKHTTSGYINKKGEMVITFKDNILEPKEFKGGLAPVIQTDEKACSYINKKGKVILNSKKLYPKKIYCGNFDGGVNVFYIDDNPREITTGYIDKNGKIKYSMLFSIPKDVSEGEFSAFDNFSSDMAQYTLDYRTGYMNKKFKMVIPAIYEFARDFVGDLAYVKFEDKEGYINKKGQWVWSKEREGM